MNQEAFSNSTECTYLEKTQRNLSDVLLDLTWSLNSRVGGYSHKNRVVGVRPAFQNTYPIYDPVCDFPYTLYL